MARSPKELQDNTAALDRRGFKVLSLAGGIAIAVMLVVLGTPEHDAETEPWIDRAAPVVPTSRAAQGVAAHDSSVDWQRAEVWTEFGPAAVAAYER
jgi:hypothetical protein